MTYQAEISRENPTCFLFLIDQSGSMSETLDSGRSKAQFLADVLNKTLATMVTRCAKADGIRHYFDVGVLAYGGNGIREPFAAQYGGESIVGIQTLGSAPLRVEQRNRTQDDGVGGIVTLTTRFPVWFDPTSDGGTPMCEAMERTAELLADWCDTHAASYPPTVIHVTDGASTDGNPESIGDSLRQIGTQSGDALVFSVHVSRQGGAEVAFPGSEWMLSDDLSRLLYRMSSPLPDHVARAAADKGYSISPASRGLIVNAGPECVVDFFDIGTRPRLLAAN
jgi:hypothetical protein